ncbi:RbtT/DalT/CsbX family MFS transporter [Actinomyces polynesiensis]|uniref:RbtT/DalT/CsbX family MFS transporter n=1 Tax=Actinomyces polynesiensis TaxID=1325934 RepID=UPI000938D055|nr:RbtT/DalT/CsbX family MFS transporter [Actinomyces polynesiensis]
MSTTPTGPAALLHRIGFPAELSLGLLAVVVFVIGDGIEAVWITDYLHHDIGYTVAQASMTVTAYGVVVAVAAFLSGALCDAIGPRRVMEIGLVSFLVFDTLFITVGLHAGSLPVLLLVYGLRGFGYPMLAYGFLTWMMMVTPPQRQSSASGWFWFAFSLGMQIIGSYLSSLLLPRAGAVPTLWAGFTLAAVGGALTLAFLRRHPSASATKGISVGASLASAASVVWRHPKVGIGGIVKVINLAGQYGLQAFYIVYLHTVHGMPLELAILEFTIFGVVAVVGDVVWGILGDRIGWRNTLQWAATPICALSLVYLYTVPNLVGPDFWLIALGMAAIGIGLSAHVPTTPLVMAHARGETGNALAILNLGAGLGAFVGPAVVTLLVGPAGFRGVALALAGLYVISFVLLFALKLPGNARVLHSAAALRLGDEEDGDEGDREQDHERDHERDCERDCERDHERDCERDRGHSDPVPAHTTLSIGAPVA